MRAVKLVEAHRLELVDVRAPEPAPGEVVVRVNGCGICGSDLTSYKAGLFTGVVPGHELAGTVAAVGTGVSAWAPGDAAIIDPKTPCGACDDCRAGAGHRCALSLTAGIGFARDGGFAELVAAPAPLLHRVPAGLSVDDACLVEPLSVAMHGVERSNIRRGDAAVVVGLGSIGLLTVAALRDRGAETVIAADPVADRRRLALDLGAANVYAEAREIRGAVANAPAVFECSGHLDAMHAAADLVAPGGTMVMLGVPFGESRVLAVMWVTREITVRGSIASSAADFDAAIARLTRRPEVDRIVTARLPLADVPAVFDVLLAPSAGGKVVIDPRL